MTTTPFVLNYTIPTGGAIISFLFTSSIGITINWGDGTQNTIVPSVSELNLREFPHTYAAAGSYVITISGTFLNSFGGGLAQAAQGRNYLTSVSSFGTLGITSLNGAFREVTSAFTVPASIPTTLVNASYMFLRTTVFNQNLNSWNMSNITNMTGMFEEARAFNNGDTAGSSNIPLTWTTTSLLNTTSVFNFARAFNQSLNSWDVSKVTNMSRMFENALVYNNSSLALTWTNNLTALTVDMSFMFNGAIVFNQSLSSWSTNNVTNMASMFYNASVFNQSLSSWNVGNVTNMSSMFIGANAFNQSLSSWDVGNVTNMSGMFQNSPIFNQDLSNWNVSRVSNMTSMFQNARVFNNGGVALTWTNTLIASTVNMTSMFQEAAIFNQSLSSWSTNNVTNMSNMFNQAIAFNQDLSNWNVSRVSNMGSMFIRALAYNNGGVALRWTNTSIAPTLIASYMFNYATVFNQDLSNWNVSNVTNMIYMFSNAPAYNNGGVALTWTTTSLTTTSYMFSFALAFNQQLIGWDVSKVTDMSFMFVGASNYNNGDPSGTFTKPLTWTNTRVASTVNMTGMFSAASKFNQSLSSWNVSNVIDMTSMFDSASAYNNSGVTLTWSNTPSVSTVNMTGMFKNAIVFNQDISSWNVSNVTNMSNMFTDASAYNNGDPSGTFTKPLTWTTTSLTNMNSMFLRASKFNQQLIGWYVSKVTDMSYMFNNASAYNNGDPSGTFTKPLTWTNTLVASTVTMFSMFQNATVFNQSLSSWNVTNVTNMANMFSTSGLLTDYYDKLINAWALQSVRTGISINAPTRSSFSQPGYTTLTTTKSWTISPTTANVTYTPTSIESGKSTTFIYTSIASKKTVINSYYDLYYNYGSGDVLLSSFQATTNSQLYTFNNVTPINPGTHIFTIKNRTSNNSVIDAVYVIVEAFKLTYTIPNSGETVGLYLGNATNITIDWGHGSPTGPITNTSITQYTHPYPSTGSITSYTITILGTSLGSFGDPNLPSTGIQYLTSVNKITDLGITSLAGAFQGATSNFTVPETLPTTITNMSYMFKNATAFNQNISTWNVDNVTNMSYMFSGANNFNKNLNSWNISKVTNMSHMFENAIAYNNNSLALTWTNNRTALTVDMSYMFNNATVFNAAISGWLTSNVTNMSYMFQGTNVFNQSLNSWDVSKVTNMSHMFENTVAYNNNSLALSWTNTRTALTVDMSYMFNNAAVFNVGMNTFYTGNVTNMSYMFKSASAFNANINTWVTSNVTNMSNMFYNAQAFNQNLSNWIISNVTDMSNMFTNSGLLTDNFDNMLNAWSLQSVKPTVPIDAQSRSSYSNSGYGILTNAPNNWSITVAANVTYTYELSKGYTNIFTYTNGTKAPVSGSTYKLLYDSTLLSTFIATETSGNTYTFNDVVINTPGILVFTVQKQSDNTIIDSVNVTVNAVCFKEGSKILCFKNNVEKYLPIENIKKGDLVKTRLNGYVPVDMIGKSQMYHKKTSERRKEQLYTCSKEMFEEVFEDLVITGCHSILVEEFTCEEQSEKAIEINNGRLCITDNKYRLPACVDDRTTVYEKEGLYTIYHLALENDDYYTNYGIYANGLLVETSSKRYLKELSGMELIE